MAANIKMKMKMKKMEKRQWMHYCIILVLSFYVAVDIFFHYHSGTHCSFISHLPLTPSEKLGGRDWDEGCSRREGYYERASGGAWKQMKWIGEAARCRVKGHLIEKLDMDDANNFRKGYALKFTPDVEDKTHLLPWLLASRTEELGMRRRRVYVDLGASSFSSSVDWFLRMYPCDFTEVHAFESNANRWNSPNNTYIDEDFNIVPDHLLAPTGIRVHSTPVVPQWMMDRIKVYFRMVSHVDDPSTNSIDISRFIKEELRLTPADTVIVKIDIEGGEWPILQKWLEDPEMPRIVDELFVEVHYTHPTMNSFGGYDDATHTREEASRLLAHLRWQGFYAHFWP